MADHISYNLGSSNMFLYCAFKFPTFNDDCVGLANHVLQ